MMSDYNSPAAIANQALDAAGLNAVTIGSLEEGTRTAQVVLRAYTECMHQLLRSCFWDFARKTAPLQMVADASGMIPNLPRMVPSGWTFAYSYPTDCMKVRYIPANYRGQYAAIPPGNILPPDAGAPLTSAPIVNSVPVRQIPSRFLVTSDPNFIPEGASNQIPGVSPIGQTLILSNVCHAQCVYTFEASYPNLWDSLFREAMVAYLAAKIAFPLHEDKKLGRAVRADNIEIAKRAINQAMVTNNNEGWSDTSSIPDWVRFRNSGGWAGNWGNGPGTLFGTLDAISWGGLGNSSAF